MQSGEILPKKKKSVCCVPSKKITQNFYCYTLRGLLLPTTLPPDGLEDLVALLERSCEDRCPLPISFARSLASARLSRDVMLGPPWDEPVYAVGRGAPEDFGMRSFPRRLREAAPRATFWSTGRKNGSGFALNQEGSHHQQATYLVSWISHDELERSWSGLTSLGT